MSGRIEDRILELDPNQADPFHKYQRIRSNQYYKNLQKNIKDKKEDKVEKPENKQDAKKAALQHRAAKKPVLKSFFKWDKDKDGEFKIRPHEKALIPKQKTIEKSGDKILSFLGYKIDFSSRTNELMEKYQKLYVESRSHNFLLAKYSELKFGMVQMLLTFLGFSTDELKKLQKKAISAAFEENEELYAQNEYNFELLTIFGTSRKDRGRQKILKEIRKQLTTQMDRLGQKGYYTPERKLDIKAREVGKILQELLQERQNLEYVRDYR